MRRNEFLSKGIEEEPVRSATMAALTAIQQSDIVVVNEIILIQELLKLLGKIRSTAHPITISRCGAVCKTSLVSLRIQEFSVSNLWDIYVQRTFLGTKIPEDEISVYPII